MVEARRGTSPLKVNIFRHNRTKGAVKEKGETPTAERVSPTETMGEGKHGRKETEEDRPPDPSAMAK